jgi:hypothetical protein
MHAPLSVWSKPEPLFDARISAFASCGHACRPGLDRIPISPNLGVALDITERKRGEERLRESEIAIRRAAASNYSSIAWFFEAAQIQKIMFLGYFSIRGSSKPHATLLPR